MAYSTINATRLELLSKNNYDTWKIQAEALLIKNDAWGYVSGEKPRPVVSTDSSTRATTQAAHDAWIIEDRKAKSDLILSINPTELKQIRGCETSKDVWDKLESIYASKGPARKATLLKRLMLHKMPEGGDVKDHLNDLLDAVDKLQSMNVEINGDMLAIIILCSLPSSFDTFRCAIESRDDLPDAETLKIKIIEESEARKQKSPDSSSGALFVKQQGQQANRFKANPRNVDNSKQSSSNTRIRCNHCRKLGHRAANCFFKKSNTDKKTYDKSETTLLINHDDESKSWCLDSGCTSHLCGNKQLFVQTTSISGGLKLANSSTTKVEATGDIKVATTVNGEERNIRLKDVLFVPDLRTNLLSVAKIVDNQHQVLFIKNCAFVKDLQGNTKIIAKRINNLFYLSEEPSPEACTASKDKQSLMKTWHDRLGHLNTRNVMSMWKTQAANGIKLDAKPTSIDCGICAAGKLSSSPFPSGNKRATGLLDIIHTDVCGPMRTKSEGGARYFVTFIDDYSRWCEVHFMKNKSEVAEKFKEFMKMTENQTGRRIKAVQSDNGKEYCNSELDNLFKERGIRRRLTVAHTPEQNGVAERKNRTLVEAARCMMIQSGLPPSFWAEAVATANHIRNRCITKGLDSGTPFEKWMGRRPNISYLKTFCCKAFILNKSPNKGKFDARGLEGTFVGYSEVSKAYRVWLPNDRRVHVSRDVKFFNQFNSKKSSEDIISKETRNGRLKILMDVDTDDEGTETQIGRNHDSTLVQIERQQIVENPDINNEEETEAEITTPHKRGPGRPKGARTNKSTPPQREYDLRSSSKQPTQLPIVIESSEDEAEHDSMFALFAGEISFSDAVTGPNATEWKDAIYDEVKSLVANDTWDLVERPKDSNIVGCRTILKNKYGANGKLERRKARIVAKGFSQRPGIDFQDTFAPVARLGSLRLLVALSTELGMAISQLDITSAYLHNDMDTTVYMDPPKLLEEMLTRMAQTEPTRKLQNKAKIMLSKLHKGHRVCLLKKALYGLRQSGRQWYLKLSKALKNAGLTATNADPCVYTDRERYIFLLVYVDDILIASRDSIKVKGIIETLKKSFTLKNLGQADYCLGIQIIKNKDCFYLSQAGYIKDLLQKFGMTDCKSASTPMVNGTKLEAGDPEDTDNSVPYRELVGSLMYLALGTRPDIAHAVSVLSQFNCNHEKKHWVAAKHVLRYLKNTMDHTLCFKRTGENFRGYVDADWGNCIIDRRSYTGMTFILAGGAISWESKKQRTVALSSTEAEYMSLTDAAKEGVYLINFLTELGFEKLAKVTIYNDNQGAKQLAHNPVCHGRSKHIDIRYNYIREVLQGQTIRLEYIPTEMMPADVLTKSLPKGKHEFCVSGLGLVPIHCTERQIEGEC